MTEQHTPTLPSGADVARYRELAIQRITYTHDEHGTAKLSAALHLTQQALAEASAYLAEIPSGGDVGEIASGLLRLVAQIDPCLVGGPDATLLTRAAAALTASEAERERLTALLNTPELIDFAKAVQIEAAHQRERWGDDHDRAKSPSDWIALAIYLLGKAVTAQWDGNREKYLHHIITLGAVANNWHSRALDSTP